MFVGAPLLTAATSRMPRKAVLVALMVIFTLGNLACALAPDYTMLMIARVVTSLAHGTFFGVGAVVATGLVAEDRKASAISIMFTGLTVATLLGVPAGAWLGLHYGWRATFWAVTAIGVIATVVIATLVPADRGDQAPMPLPRGTARWSRRPQVLLGLLMTVLGFAGVFTVFTYIQPILTRVTGFADSAVSPILLVFGVGMIVGNLLGGRLADRRLMPALLGTLAALALVLGADDVRAAQQDGRRCCSSACSASPRSPPCRRCSCGCCSKADRRRRAWHRASTSAPSISAMRFGAWLGGVVIECMAPASER